MDMKKTTEKLAEQADKLQELSSGTNVALAEMRLQFETLAEMQKDERIEIQKMHVLEKETLMKQFTNDLESQRKHYTRIIYALILTLVIILGSVIGGIIYIFTNYDIAVDTYQDLYSGDNGTSTIYDGIHITGN